MGGVGKVCDSCKSATASVFCRADSAYLCMGCDCKVHAANKLASRHARVWVCEVCEQSPATVTCKADAAHLCSSCDRDIHSANPLARRHERVPLSPFFDITSSHPTHTHEDDNTHSAAANAAKSAAISKLFGDDYYSDADEAEAASWLLHNPNPNPSNKSSDPDKSIDYLFSPGANDGEDIDPYLDLDFSADPKPDPSSDGVVPDPDHKQINHNLQQHQQQHQSVYSLPAASYHHNLLDAFDHGVAACKPYSLPYNPHTQSSMSHSVSSSSLDFGVVPDASVVGDGQSTGMEKNQNQNQHQQMKVIGLDREARVLRYREKRKNRKFEKTIRYASRKAYAETRPRIKGRFAKRTEAEPAASVDSLFASDPGYGVVPSF